MHTHRTADGRIIINHNSDWSGDAIIRVRGNGLEFPPRPLREVTIPGHVVLSGDYESPVDCPLTERELRRATALAMYLHVTSQATASLGQIDAPGVI